MDITVVCPRDSKRYRIHKSQLGTHVCPDCRTVTVVPAAPLNPATATSKPVAPSISAVAPAPNRVTPPQPKPAQQPSTPSPPICTRKKRSIGLRAGGGIGVLVIIAVVAVAIVPRHRGHQAVKPVTEPNASTPEPVTRETKDPEEIHANCAASVVFIKGKLGSGSGFVVSRNLIATNSHVIRLEFSKNLEIEFPSASTKEDKGPFHAQVVYEDAKRDLAFLSVQTKLSPLKGAKSFEFHSGMPITIIGSPGVGDGVVKNAVSIGVLSAKDRQMDQDFYQLGASLNPGNSGAPVFDKYDEVIGVATLKASQQEAIAWCIPIDDLRSGISLVGSQSQKTAAETGSRHRLRVVCRLLTKHGSVIAQGMDAFTQEMLDSIKRNEDPKEGLNAAAYKILPVLKGLDGKLTDTGLKDEIGALSTNPATDRQTRELLLALCDTIQRMKTLLDKPTSPPLAFANDAGKLKTIFLDLSYITKFRLGIPADED